MIKEVLKAIRYAYDLVSLRVYNTFNFVLDLIVPNWMPQDSREIAQDWLKDVVKDLLSGGGFCDAEVNPLLVGMAAVLGWVVVGFRRAFRWTFGTKGE